MKFRYLLDRAQVPQVALGGGVVRPRPIIPIRITNATGNSLLLDGHLDTGADDTVFPAWVAASIGLDLTTAPFQDIHLAGRGQPFRAHYGSVLLRLTDGLQQSYEWPAMVAFVPVPLRRPLLGYAGCLQFLDAEFRGADQEVILLPNISFPGTLTDHGGP